ncbi:hypothetical protein F5Y05DRAFT_316565 [Hypoxylon sp. FL0543]|nr:hypothetical protein F5Y05DRAFT_316565 [Hypoxylon sp. FL0543]
MKTVCPIGIVSLSFGLVSGSGKPTGNAGAGSYPTESNGAASKPEIESATALGASSTGYIATTNNAATLSPTGGSGSGSSNAENNVVVTATVYPVTSINGGYNATLATTATIPIGGCCGDWIRR